MQVHTTVLLNCVYYIYISVGCLQYSGLLVKDAPDEFKYGNYILVSKLPATMEGSLIFIPLR